MAYTKITSSIRSNLVQRTLLNLDFNIVAAPDETTVIVEDDHTDDVPQILWDLDPNACVECELIDADQLDPYL